MSTVMGTETEVHDPLNVITITKLKLPTSNTKMIALSEYATTYPHYLITLKASYCVHLISVLKKSLGEFNF